MITKTYPANLPVDEVASRLESTFRSDGYEVQRIGSGNDVAIQIRKTHGTIRTVFGLDQALTVRIQNSPTYTTVTLGQAKWADKAVVEAVGFLVFLPLMVPASYGIYEQHKLPGRVLKIIDDIASSRGITTPPLASSPASGAPGSSVVEATHCPHCGVTNASTAQYCSACGSPLKAGSAPQTATAQQTH
jgi:uncharacterized protein (DUF302 family)